MNLEWIPGAYDLERVVRLSRKGGRLNYVSLVGPAAALDSLDGQKDV